jgi:cellobiose-specific phosphotransferase system component IIA
MSEENKDTVQSYEVSFQMILHAGDARGNAARAVDAANQYDFDKAEEYLKEANRELKEAHKVQTEQIQAEAGGAVCTVNLMMVHAQDHFTMALMAIDQAKEAIYLNRKLDAMEHSGKGIK